MKAGLLSVVVAAALVRGTPLSDILGARQDEIAPVDVPVEDITDSAQSGADLNYEVVRVIPCHLIYVAHLNLSGEMWLETRERCQIPGRLTGRIPTASRSPTILETSFFKAKPRLDCQQLETDNCNAFSPIKADIMRAAANLVETKRILDGIALGFAFVSAFLFNSWFKKVPAFRNNPNAMGTAKDDINALVAFGINYQKDGLSSGANSIISIDNQMSTLFTNVTDTWITATHKMAEGIFTDWPKLYQLIVNGKTWSPDVGNSPLEVTDVVKKVMYGAVIPNVWSTGPDSHMPFIATSEGLSQDGTSCESWNPESGLSESLKTHVSVDKDAFDGARICDGDDAYFMVAIGKSSDCPFGEAWPCTHNPPQSEASPGRRRADERPVLSHVRRYGSQVGTLSIPRRDKCYACLVPSTPGRPTVTRMAGVPQTLNNPEAVRDITDVGEGAIANMKGLVKIPVCSFNEAYQNAYWYQLDMRGARGDAPNNPYWPCNNA
ncbi:hypothetical protein NM208_g1923 [Fusarium decemcellulare]|uniref:Uncharacterized protein n=1 Tax=Fusarium decemcellulare TaxID=57161 RepID=A0ACC1SUL3_9HYPO|nr:hypothetical protein NM208_g1923 [Fusarium decemcellulare]